MNCKCSYRTDEFHGWGCKITRGECMFLFSDSKACAEIFGEGPDAVVDLVSPQDGPDDSK